jgi:hypothetical protein
MKPFKQFAVIAFWSYLFAFTACDFAYPAVEGKFDRTLKVTGRVDLEVTTGSGSIDVRAGSSSVVEIHGMIRANDDWKSNAQEKVRFLTANPPIQQSGNVIRVGQIEDRTYANNVSISYEILVPAETQVQTKTGSGSEKIDGVRGPIEASTGSGSISLYNIASDVSAHTGSGSIRLDQIAGSVEVHTGSGSIHGGNIAGSIIAKTGSGGIRLGQTAAEKGATREVEISTGSGSIEITGVNGPLHAKSGSGGISVTGNPSGDWELDASSGGLTLTLTSDAAFDLYAHSSSGRISVDHPVTVTGTISKHEMRGKVRGGGHLIDVRSSSGSITIR